MFSSYHKLFQGLLKTRILAILALTLGFACLNQAGAQVAAVARNPTIPYQQSRFGHVHRVLLYTYIFNGGHDQSFITNCLKKLAAVYGFQLDVSNSNSYINDNSLGLTGPDTANPVNVTVFSNGDGDQLVNATSLATMKKFIEVKGGGILLSHASGAYVPCPNKGDEILDDVNCRWEARVLVRQYLAHNAYPNYARIYVDSVKTGEIPPHATGTGAVAAGWDHGKRVPEFKAIFDSLPSNLGIIGGPEPDVWDSLGDEWYNYRGYVRQQGAKTYDGVAFGPVIALMSQDETAPYTAASLHMGDRVQVWARHAGLGLSIYTNMGHGNSYPASRKVHGITVNDSVETKMTFRYLRYLARDFVGCMTVGDANYNPAASTLAINDLDKASPCGGVSAINLKSGAAYNGITAAYRGIHISTSENGSYQVLVVDARGKQYFNHDFTGGKGKNLDVSNLSKGQYYVYVTTPKNGHNVTGVRLD